MDATDVQTSVVLCVTGLQIRIPSPDSVVEAFRGTDDPERRLSWLAVTGGLLGRFPGWSVSWKERCRLCVVIGSGVFTSNGEALKVVAVCGGETICGTLKLAMVFIISILLFAAFANGMYT